MRSVNRPSELLPEPMFLRALSLERKRAERSGKRFLLMLIDFGRAATNGSGHDLRGKTASALLGRIRETDISGWYAADGVLGVIFTEFGGADERAALPILRARTTAALESALMEEERQQLGIGFHWFPDDALTDEVASTVCLEHTQRDAVKEVSRPVKRVIDVLGSGLALAFSRGAFWRSPRPSSSRHRAPSSSESGSPRPRVSS